MYEVFIISGIVLLLVFALVYAAGIKLKRKKLFGALLILILFYLVLYQGLNWFPNEYVAGATFDDFYAVIDLTKPESGTLYVYDDRLIPPCQSSDIYEDIRYSAIAHDLLELQYHGEFDKTWEPALIGTRAGKSVKFTAIDPSQFRFKTASFSLASGTALYETWHVKIIFPEGYQLDNSTCKGDICSETKYYSEAGRDVAEFNRMGAGFTFKILYRYSG
jgi:hypothetical protein